VWGRVGRGGFSIVGRYRGSGQLEACLFELLGTWEGRNFFDGHCGGFGREEIVDWSLFKFSDGVLDLLALGNH
jgi:hypothetical protein